MGAPSRPGTAPPAPARPQAGWRARVDTALLLVGLALVQVLPTHLEGDGLARYEVLDAVARGRPLAGARYPLWGSLPALPLYAIGRAIGHPRLLTAHYNGLVLAAAVGGLWLTLRHHLAAPTVRAFLLVVVGASMFAAHAGEFYGEMFSATTIGIGVAVGVTRRGWDGWLLAAVGAANIPAAAPALAVVVVWRVWRERRPGPLVALAATVVLVVVDAAVRHQSLLFGSYAHDHGPLTVLPYSGRSGFSYPPVLGVWGIVFSFGKGLIFFVPGLVLALTGGVRRRLRGRSADVMVAWLVFTAALIAVYCRWWGWDGGLFWGPRFFLLACLPASLALAVLLTRPPSSAMGLVVVVAVMAASVYVAVNGASFESRDALRFCQAHAADLPMLCSEVPEFSPLWRPFLDVLHPSVAQWAFAAWAALTGSWLALPALGELWSVGLRRMRDLRPADPLRGWRW